MAATRISDGSIVSIKRINSRTQEISIALFLSNEANDSNDSTNHCVPILDHFSDQSLPQVTFLVMPLLRPFGDPPFFSVAEAVDFIQQTLEV